MRLNTLIPNGGAPMTLPYAESFFRSATLRHAIYYKKEVLKLPYPWSDDERFNSVFFCNVFRWLDKTTKRIVKALPTINTDEDYRRLVAYRYVSRTSTIDVLEEKWDGSADSLDALCKDIHPLYTGGFTICPIGRTPKYKNVGIVVRQIQPDKVRRLSSIEAICAYIRTLKGIGPFMAYEIATDLSYYIPYKDECKWSNPGPGAMRGMSRVLYGDVRHMPTDCYQEFSQELYTQWKDYDVLSDMEQYLRPKHALLATAPFKFDLTMREVEHWLCEYDKYKRQTHNRRKYP